MTTDYISRASFEHILSALMPENRLALIVSMTTGLRIDDVLHLRTKDVIKGRFTIREMKTGKAFSFHLKNNYFIQMSKNNINHYKSR